MKETGYGTASGKIILMGEHAVVYGEPAIAFPFSGTNITAAIYPSTANTLDCLFYRGALDKAPASLKSVKALIHRFIKDFQIQRSFQLKIDSTIPAERGMGSSAAVAVAITRAFFDWLEIDATQKEILTYVEHAEKIAHANPSGIDAAAISGTSAILYQKGLALKPFDAKIDAFLVVADTGIKGQTRQAVKDVARLFEQDPKNVASLIEKIGQLTLTAQQALLENNPLVLGECMDQSQTALKALGVSHPALDDLIAEAKNAGALGAKLTGGGRGGCMIALAENHAAGKAIQQKLSDSGARAVWMQGLGVYANV